METNEGRAKILVIDDEEVIRSLLADVLGDKGYDVTAVATGEEGYQEAYNKDFDVMIIDLMLPGDDGLKIINFIKKNDPDAVIIVITGCNSMESIQEALRLGAFDYITKPFDIEQISFAVNRAVNSKSLVDTNKRLLRGLSEQNVDLEKKVAERTQKLTVANENLKEVYIRMIATLISVIEAKDAYTRSHSENVAKYSVAIAKEMALSDDQIDLINKAAQLHDIGKIGIDDSILNKPGKLTAEEFDIIKEHPMKAQEILKPLDFLNDAIELIRQHHERYDGKGYPSGNKGDQIPIGARIMAVADTYDAMISGRPYRQSLFSKDQVIEEIRQNAGTQFDPKVVEAFLRIAHSL